MTELVQDLHQRFPGVHQVQQTRDPTPTLWVDRDHAHTVLDWLRTEVPQPYPMLFDLYAIDERERLHREGQPDSDFTVVYHLLSFDRNEDLRLKVGVPEDDASVPTVVDLWPSARWYEREAFDMLGVDFAGHAPLRRLLMPPTWEGHPLRKEHPARATEMPAPRLDRKHLQDALEAMQFVPEAWGLASRSEDTEYLFLNLGPQHPGTHGVLRFVLQLDGESIVEVVPDIGYHHRGAEKMAERQTWHSFIPFTNRVDYMAGVLNSMAYVQAVERLAGIEVPDRVKVIRVMLCELFRVINHLVFLGGFGQDLGQLSPVFYTFTDRERAFDIVEAITGGRMHPNWLRIGGIAQDLPVGWDGMMRDFLAHMPRRLRDYEVAILGTQLIRARTMGVGACTREQAISWGVTGPMLRATGLAWDFRKARPYSGYDWFDFEVPTADHSDCYSRAQVRLAELHQSLRILAQCVENMPEGAYKADHPLTTPPRKDPGTMQDIDTLIRHFVSVSWGPVIPPGEASFVAEGGKGAIGYALVSDGDSRSYRTRIRTPSFAHIQFVPELSRGHMIQDLIAVLSAVDFVLADVDR